MWAKADVAWGVARPEGKCAKRSQFAGSNGLNGSRGRARMPAATRRGGVRQRSGSCGGGTVKLVLTVGAPMDPVAQEDTLKLRLGVPPIGPELFCHDLVAHPGEGDWWETCCTGTEFVVDSEGMTLGPRSWSIHADEAAQNDSQQQVAGHAKHVARWWVSRFGH
jgi:hypothetical protein